MCAYTYRINFSCVREEANKCSATSIEAECRLKSMDLQRTSYSQWGIIAVQLGGIVSLLDIERELTFAAAIQICRERRQGRRVQRTRSQILLLRSHINAMGIISELRSPLL